jgi:1,4-alpha-glucan branching enzyme
MKRCLIAVFTALLLTSGCVSHFYRVEDDQVTFYIDLPAAQQVEFAYSLDEFRLHSVQKKWAGTWEITVPADIEFRYFFIVDGALYLPGCDIREADDFGYENCIFDPVR